VAVYLNSALAEEALSRLQLAGFAPSQLSFVGRDTWANAAGSYSTGEGFQYCGILGPFWGRLWAILPGRGVFWFCATGPMLVAGPLVRIIVAAQEGATCDTSINRFAGGLSGIGIPEDSIVQYEEAVRNDQILLFVLGTLDEVDRADHVLNDTEELNHTLHHAALAA
jgi:uncharacterized membrane protein